MHAHTAGCSCFSLAHAPSHRCSRPVTFAPVRPQPRRASLA
jgi:hypothetical protein